MLNKLIKYFLHNRLVTVILLVFVITLGLITSPFSWDLKPLPSDPVPVDAIPDIGENQQIVFTKWDGRSPQDIEDQISYPLTTYLLGIPGVKSIRSTSIIGFSSIYIIFSEDVEFYWSRSRIIEKLNSIPSGLMPEGVQPTLGPDATALGQVFWYTLEGRDSVGNPTGGWELDELRSIQDFYIKFSLNSVEGVSEVASIGGYVKEYQIDVNPDILKTYGIQLHQVMNAVQESNIDVGAKTIEVNQVEYIVRGIGYIKEIEDIEQAVVAVHNNVPITIKDIGIVYLGPASRRGLLDKGGAEVVGGVVVVRYGSNPLQVINNIKEKIIEISPGLPKKVLPDGTESQLTIVPFYDRSELIYETLGTLEEALSLEILITILVVILLVYNLRASLLISSLLPIAVLMVFIAMRYTGVDANIVALSGIAIAIGTMVDLGIIMSENIIKKIKEASEKQKLIDSIFKGASEVSSAIMTAVATTIVSFIPVFTLQAAEGKLFGPLAFTKTFALAAAVIVSLLIMPTLAYWFFGFKIRNKKLVNIFDIIVLILGVTLLFFDNNFAVIILISYGVFAQFKKISTSKSESFKSKSSLALLWIINNSHIIISVIGVTWILAKFWLPLGANKSVFLNFVFVAIILTIILGGFTLLEHYYKRILQWCLDNKVKFLLIPVILVFFGINIWLGFDKIFGIIGNGSEYIGWEIRKTKIWKYFDTTFPGIGKEFMPSLDEGSFLLMPTSMPHSGFEFNRKVVGQLDMLISQIPEIDLVVGKLGRVESALDPAPISMFENVINYKPEYALNDKGRKIRFRIDKENKFILKNGEHYSNDEALIAGITSEQLIRDDDGIYFRNWRSHIKSADDIWQEIINIAKIPGVTSAPKLQPIETRLVMLQTGMRAPMGIKIYGTNLDSIQDFGIQLEAILKTVPSIKTEAVFADRIVGKPYIHINIDREKISRFGLSVADVQQTIQTAIGGMKVTTTVEGRSRYAVRVRYPRELRDNPESLNKIIIATPTGAQIPLSQIVEIEYYRGPQAIKSENTFLVGYVLFDKKEGFAEVDVVNDAQETIQAKIDSGELIVPAGISYKFSGSFENQIRAEKRLSFIVPVVLLLVFLILFLQFKSVSTSLMVFSGIILAFSGGFIVIWLYSQVWFADFAIFGTNFRDLFQIHTINLSVAVWVGFIALFGIATDDGVLMATYLDQSFVYNQTKNVKDIRIAVVQAGYRRIKPAVMTSATTIIALLPILTSTGRGADIMIPMAIPAFGGMLIASITYFIVPVLYSFREERKLKKIRL